jgi:hypothetical protein
MASLCVEVRDQMADHVFRFVTPISRSDDLIHGFAWATGNYVRLNSSAYLLTNEPVIRKAIGFHLAHLPGPTDDYIGCADAILTAGWPIDLALMRLWNEPAGSTRGVLASPYLERSYSPAPCELMFWLGYPGSTAERHEPVTPQKTRYSWFGSLETPAVPCLMQEVQNTPLELEGFDPDIHVALHYPSHAITTLGVGPKALPNPSGMSGSLLWDTKFVACTTAGKQWGPEEARVCGLVFGAVTQPEVVLATRIEHVRPAVLSFLREECAYLHWIDRGRPLWESLVDWNHAESVIRDI